MRAINFRARSRVLSVVFLSVVLATLSAAQTPIQFGVFYSCSRELRFKIFSCAGNEPCSTCEIQAFNGAQTPRRGPAPRAQVMSMVQACHLETAAEEKAAASSRPAQQSASQASSNGISVGDSVEVIT